MFVCPKCHCKRSRVLESRAHVFRGEDIQVRIRSCVHCGHRYRTKETVDPELTMPSNANRRKKNIEEQPEQPEIIQEEPEKGKNPLL